MAIVTSRDCQALVSCHIRWLFLHTQIGAKFIFTGE